jgi:hypothetical protein
MFAGGAVYESLLASVVAGLSTGIRRP